MGEGHLVFYLARWLAMCIFEIAIFEVDAPLKWHLSNQSLSQGLALQKRKKKKTVSVYSTVTLVH